MPYGLHEQLEVHEIAVFKTICMSKSKTMQALVSDDVLSQLLAEDADVSTRQLEELREILSKASTREGMES